MQASEFGIRKMNTFKWSVPQFSEATDKTRRKAFAVTAISNTAIAISGICYPLYLNIPYNDSQGWALMEFLVWWFPIATVTWLVGLLILFAMLLKKEKISKVMIALNQSSLILFLATFVYYGVLSTN